MVGFCFAFVRLFLFSNNHIFETFLILPQLINIMNNLQCHEINQRIDAHDHNTDEFTQALFAMEHSGVIYCTDLGDNPVTYQLSSIKDFWTPRLPISDCGGRRAPAARSGGLPNVSP